MNNTNKRKFRRNDGRYKLPDRWNNYTAMGNIVPGTRFFPFKTPLREEICRRALSHNNWFTPAMLLEKAPNVKLIIDLTQTDRFYSKEDFVKNGVRHKKIVCRGGGQQLPPQHIIQEFTRAVDAFLESEDALNEDYLIGVHCTHGLNRTGYLICKYMVEHYGIAADQAIEDFENARGHKMERHLYVNDIRGILEPSYNNLQFKRRCSTSPSHSQESHFEHHDQRLPKRMFMEPNRFSKPASFYQQQSPLEDCYTDNKLRYSSYTKRDFYPRFNKRD